VNGVHLVLFGMHNRTFHPISAIASQVAVPTGALLVNLGSLMARWTGGAWKSTLHRVTNPAPDVAASSRRLSLAFFHKVRAGRRSVLVTEGNGMQGLSGMCR
jgi:2OG-Fe(II) oxygenase superfamily